MNKTKIFQWVKYSIYILIIISFLIIYFASESGYFDSIKSKNVELTKEQIAKFEEDISLGKEIDINDYYSEIDNPYDNKFTKLGIYISNKIESVVGTILDKTFKALNDFLNS